MTAFEKSDPLPNPLLVPLTRYADGLDAVSRQEGCSDRTRAKLREAARLVRAAANGAEAAPDADERAKAMCRAFWGDESDAMWSNIAEACREDWRRAVRAADATLPRATPAPLTEAAFELEGLLESLESAGVGGWTLPDGSNALVKVEGGHLSVVQSSLLRSWIVKVRALLAASRGDIPAAVRPESSPAVQAAIRGLERVAPETLGTYGQEANDAVRSDESSKGSRGAEARDAGADVQVRANDQGERIRRPQAGLSDVARVGEGERGGHPAQGGPVDAPPPDHTDGDTCPSCSEILGSPSVCAISHDFRPGAYDGAEMAVTGGFLTNECSEWDAPDPWTPTVGARVVTAAVLKSGFGGNRQTNTAGEVVRLLDKLRHDVWVVRHDDGTEAPYDAVELRPEKR